MTEDRIAELEQRLRALEDERDIARLLASYGPLVDAGMADAVAQLWTEDGIYDVGDWRMAGRSEIAAMVRSEAHQELLTRGCSHFFGPAAIRVDGDTAVAVCESTLAVRRDSGGYSMLRAGVHVLRLRRVAEEWRIISRTARQFDGGDCTRAMIAAAFGDSP